jgi:putative tricarboxylic transport membrane protein
MVEQAFVTSLIKSDGSILPFFERAIFAILATFAIGALIWPVLLWLWLRLRQSAPLPPRHRRPEWRSSHARHAQPG